MLFKKEDLKGDYQWDFGPSSFEFSGAPSRRIFNRYNGNQVLFLINYFISQDQNFSREDAHKLEDMITNLPLVTKSEISVLNNLKGLKAHNTVLPNNN